jgi:parallel beta-helix repeat protein
LGRITIGGFSVRISRNTVYGFVTLKGFGGSPVIENNTIMPPIITTTTGFWSNTDWYPGIVLEGSFTNATVSSNILSNCSSAIKVTSGSAIIEGNSISNNKDHGIDVELASSVTIDGNYITDSNYGINDSGSSWNRVIKNNVIVNNSIGIHAPGSGTIERNLINGNEYGIVNGGTDVTIRNNTIIGCNFGLFTVSASSLIISNNIYNNTYNLYFTDTSDLDATYNWWGTTDTQTINQTIFDFKNDFKIGTITFVPFLTEPNPEAMPIPEFPSWIILPLFLITTLLAVIVNKKKKHVLTAKN